MSVKCNITPELGRAVGRIAAAHPDAGIQIEWREGEPEQVWHVLAEYGTEGDAHYLVNDETGDIISNETGDIIHYGIDLREAR